MLLQQVPETHGSVLQHLKWSDSNLHPGNCERTELTCLMKFAVRSKCAIDNAEVTQVQRVEDSIAPALEQLCNFFRSLVADEVSSNGQDLQVRAISQPLLPPIQPW
eukprot:2337042-Rhodomonas_salina.2